MYHQRHQLTVITKMFSNNDPINLMQAQLKCILEYESRSKYLFTRFPITGRILFIYAHKDFIDECNSQLKPIEHLGVVHKGRPQNMG